MPKAPLPPIATLGINIGNNSFHLIGMNACIDAHHLSGQLLALGHDVKLIPAQFVKPFRKSHKNDFRDADAIAEAVQRPTMPSCRSRRSNSSICKFLIVFVHGWRATHGSPQPDPHLLLERGIAVRQGLRLLRQALSDKPAVQP